MATEKDESKGKKHLHSGHRERMKDRLFNSGIENFSEHEMLEFFLFYALPYVNTNNIAHELIYKFGSLTGVINADYGDLLKVKGMGKNAASMFYFFRSFAKVYLNKTYLKTFDVTNRKLLTDYCKTLFLTSVTEEIRLILLNDDLSYMKDVLICEGTPGKVSIPFRKMAEEALGAKTNRIVLAHNHPKGPCIPSRADVDETERISQNFKQMSIELVDHIIIGTDGEWSMRFDHTLTGIWKEFC